MGFSKMRQRIGYGSADLASNLIWPMITAYLTPYYTDALASRADRYNACREQLFELEEQGRVLILEPPRPVEVGNTGADGQKLLELYLQGAGYQEISSILGKNIKSVDNALQRIRKKVGCCLRLGSEWLQK